jgi:hypothetical protein
VPHNHFVHLVVAQVGAFQRAPDRGRPEEFDWHFSQRTEKRANRRSGITGDDGFFRIAPPRT